MTTPEAEYLIRRGQMVQQAARHGVDTGFGRLPVSSSGQSSSLAGQPTYSDLDGNEATRLRNITQDGYVLTPNGAKRLKQPRISPSLMATLSDTRNGGHGHVLPAGVAKADDPGARLSRAERRARVSGAASLPIPFAGDMIMAGTAAQMSPEQYRKRTAAQMYGSSQGGQYAGYAAGALGASALAERNPQARAAFSSADRRMKSAKTKAFNSTPKGFQDKYRETKGRWDKREPSWVGAQAGKAKSAAGKTRAGRLISRNPSAAAMGMLLGGMVGGQSAQQTMYGHVMNRDDKYRQQMSKALYSLQSSSVSKSMNTQERHELAERKRRAARLSTISGVAGMGALGASLGTAGIKNADKIRRAVRTARAGEPVVIRQKRPVSAVQALDSVKTPLLGVSAGVGGYSSMNFAQMNRQEAENLDPERNRIRRERYAQRKQEMSKAAGSVLPPAQGTPGPSKPRSTTRRSHTRVIRMPSGKIVSSNVQGSQR